MSTVSINNVEVAVPPGVRVDVGAGGVVSLHFSSFSGSITLTPPAPRAGEKRLLSSDESMAEKRVRNVETPADEISENASCAPAALSALRTDHHEAFFRNGGGMSPSQEDSDDDNEQAPPRVLTWEEACAAGPPSTQPEPSLKRDPTPYPPSPDGEEEEGGAASRTHEPAAITTAAAAREMLLAGGALAKVSPGASSSASGGRTGGGTPLVAPSPVSAAKSVAGASGGRALSSGHKGGSSAGKQRALLADASSAAADGAAGGDGLAERLRAADVFPFACTDKLDEWEWRPLTPTGAPPPPRWGHCAASLGGMLYVMGGDDLTDSDDDILRDLYRLDPTLNAWKKCRDAPHGRCWHTLTVVGGSVSGNSDILLAFGGETIKSGTSTRTALNTMLSYDPEFEVWYDAVDRGTRPSARLGHSASLHTANGDGAAEKLVVFGGWSGRKYAEPELRELHIGADWAWRKVLTAGQPPLARSYHTATRLAGEKLVVFGGHDADLRTFSKPHLLDLTTMAWHHPTAVTGTPPAPRTGHAAVCLDGVRVLLHGGWEPLGSSEQDGADAYRLHDDLAVLCTATWRWTHPTVRGVPPCPRVGHSLVALPTGGGEHALVLFGGRTEGEVPLNDTYSLCPAQ